MFKLSVIGASGYIGMELVKLLALHDKVELVHVTSRRYKSRKLWEVLPQLRCILDIEFSDPDPESIASESDLVMLAVPHGSSMDYVPHFLKKLKIIDLSADYRLDPRIYEETYGIKHRYPARAIYGLSELHPEIRNADFVANPGCYPTGAVLAIAPLASHGYLDWVIFDAKSGISGAGSHPSEFTHFPSLAENIKPYQITSHRHIPEIRQELDRLSPGLKFWFTPHAIPVIRGILTTCHGYLNTQLTQSDLEQIYTEFYRNSKFVRIVDGIPSLLAVRNSNFCDIGFQLDRDKRRVVVISAIDNLVKGGAGQAIQNMNLMLGLDEAEGLWMPGSGI